MATRFYLPSTGTPSISPAFGSAWNVTTNADRMTMVTTRITSAMTDKAGVGDSSTATQLLRQYISASLAAQTLSGTLKGVMRCLGTNAGDGALVFRLAKCDSTGATVTEIIAQTIPSDATGSIPPAFANTLTNRRLESTRDNFSHTVPSTSISAGERLVLELGYKDNTSNGTRSSTINLGDDSATDLPEDESTTAADNPWVEFSADIAFEAGGSGGQIYTMQNPGKGFGPHKSAQLGGMLD